MMNTNNDLKLSSLELCKNSKEEVGPDRSVSSNKFSSVTLNKLAMNRYNMYSFKLQQCSQSKD